MSTNVEQLLSCIEIEPTVPATHSVIWMHGLGADGHDFVSLVPDLSLPKELGIRFIFPNAPVRPVTINGGYQMRAWYDITGITLEARIDKEGIIDSILAVNALIEREVNRGIPTNKIILAGFSQGAVMALTTGLRYHQPLAGILALSGYFPLHEETIALAKANRNTPIFLAHGTEDVGVPYALGIMAYSQLKDAGLPVSWHAYPMGHSVCMEEIQDISKWMQGVCQ